MRERALDLWRRGLNVFRVPRPRPGVPNGEPGDGKTPVTRWKTWQTVRQTEADVRAMFAGAPMNIAIICGAISGVCVVDADAAESLRWVTKHLPYTPWQVQTARGWHFYYAHPGVRVPNRARIETRDGRLAVDVRGDGGYVIAAGSLHHTGVAYRFAGDWTVDRDALPRFWSGWLARPERPAQAPATVTPRPQGDVIDRARRYLSAIPRPEIGAGSDRDTLYAACRLVRGFGLSEADATTLLWEWAAGRPGWTHSWIVNKVQSAVRYGSEPVGALR